jgi:hypothetical protein
MEAGDDMQDSLPHPAPTLESLWADAQAGAVPWSVVQEHQANMMPRCANHSDRPMSTFQNKTPLCADCYVAWIKSNAQT